MNKYDHKLMQQALSWAEMSSASRLQVGAVLAREGRPIAVGYNGTVPGLDNCCEDKEGKTKVSTLHAEENILVQCAREGISTKGASMYVTHFPCGHCAALIASIGVNELFYKDVYRDMQEGMEIFLIKGISVVQVEV